MTEPQPARPSAIGDYIAQAYGQGARAEVNINYNTYTGYPLDSALTPDETVAPLPDLFPPARHLIGRQAELHQLLDLYQRLIAQKQGGIVFITGRPGYGRLALARTLAEVAQAQETPVLIGRFKPVARLTPTAAASLWVDDPFIGPALTTYGERLQQFWPQACRLGGPSWLALTAQIAQQMGYAPYPEEQQVADKPEAIKRLLRRMSHRRPSVLLLENLDEAPDFWLDLLKYMVPEIGRELSCLIIATAQAGQPLARLPDDRRTDTLHLAHTLNKADQADIVWLDQVSRAEVAGYLGPTQPRLAERLHHLADGIPVMIETLWQEWLDYEVVQQDQGGQWVATGADEWWVFGQTRDQAYHLLDDCLVDEAPFNLAEVETMLTYAALEGYTFTAQAVARVMGQDADDLQDFWDECLLETEAWTGLLADAGFALVSGSRGRQLNLYRFASPYLWHVWGKYQAGSGLDKAARLAEALEAVYYPQTDLVAPTLITLFEISGQHNRAEPYRRRRQTTLDLGNLRWRVTLLAQLATDRFDQYRLFDLRLELSSRLYDSGQYGEGYSQAEAALTLARQWDDRLREGRAGNLSGLNLHAQGEYEAARPYYERSLAIREEVLGPKHPSTATSLNNLALLLKDQGEYEAARPYYERSLAIREEVLGPKHPDTATSLNNLAGLLHDQGEYEAARPYYERSLAICEEVLGPKHPSTATSLNNLALLLHDQGEYEAARPYYERSLAICEEVLGPKHPDTATSLNNLAGLLHDQGEYEAARPYYERSLAIREEVLGPKHPDTATSLNNLAGLLQAQGEYEAARPYYERSLAIREEVLGPKHPDAAQSLNNLAVLLQAQGEYEAARPYYERSLAISEEVLGPKHPDTAQSLNNLAVLLQAQGEYEAARPYYERSLAIWEEVLGPKHPNTQIVRTNLATVEKHLEKG